MLKISAFYLDKQKSFVPKKKCGILVIETLKCKISDFLNSNTCFCSRLYGRLKIISSTSLWSQGTLQITMVCAPGPAHAVTYLRHPPSMLYDNLTTIHYYVVVLVVCSISCSSNTGSSMSFLIFLTGRKNEFEIQISLETV